MEIGSKWFGMKLPKLRLARPVSDLNRSLEMYSKGLGFEVLARFENHAGFDGVILGHIGSTYHFEFTVCQHHPVVPSPTEDDLVVFYLPDHQDWHQTCENMESAGFVWMPSFNPYWDVQGKTFADQDGYRIVIQNAVWN